MRQRPLRSCGVHPRSGEFGVLLICFAVLILVLLSLVMLLKPASIPRQQAFVRGEGDGLKVQCYMFVSGCLEPANNLGHKGGVTGGAGQLGNNFEVFQYRLVTAGAA
jgi:hypothetical protein